MSENMHESLARAFSAFAIHALTGRPLEDCIEAMRYGAIEPAAANAAEVVIERFGLTRELEEARERERALREALDQVAYMLGLERPSPAQIEAARSTVRRALAALRSAPSGVEEERCAHLFDAVKCVYCGEPSPRQPAAPVPARQGEPTGCYDCGRRYGDAHGFPDLLIPDWAWERIMPGRNGGGLLCPSCIAQRCVAAGLSSVPAMWASGPLMGEPYRDGDGGGRDWLKQPAPKRAGASGEGGGE